MVRLSAWTTTSQIHEYWLFFALDSGAIEKDGRQTTKSDSIRLICVPPASWCRVSKVSAPAKELPHDEKPS